MKLKVEPPRVNRSQFRFAVAEARTVVYGLGAIRGVGESAIEGIHEARETGGPFSDLFEFCRRIDPRRVNRRVLESLIKAGALDELGPNRATLMAQLPLALRMAEQSLAMQAAGQSDLFGMADGEVTAVPDLGVIPEVCADWEDDVRLAGEKETLGLYLTGHPIDHYLVEFVPLGVNRIGEIVEQGGPLEVGGWRRGPQRVALAGLVVSLSKRQTQRGPMASLLLDDRSGRMEVVLFGEAYDQHRDLLAADKVLYAEGALVYDEYRGGFSVRADRVVEFERARAVLASHLVLRTDRQLVGGARSAVDQFTTGLAKTLAPFRGGPCAVALEYSRGDARGTVVLGEGWRVDPRDALLRQLERVLGPGNVTVGYEGGRGAPRRRAGVA
jgi:DNA polymerase-3 subunit alpha